ncbi:MAG TPA: hypothetical protein VES03_11390 [Motilibacterales bacterium]|nr:hypothetical protein [Motilibacterales bacterium]
MKKLMSLTAFGLGYVLGARAGRGRYDQLMRGFTRVREDPRVQEQAHHVAQAAKDRAPVAKDKVSDLASSALHRLRPPSADSQDPDGGAEFPEASTAQQEVPIPASLP